MSLQIWSAQSDRECLQVREVEWQMECATGNKRKYGFGNECSVLWGNYGSNWPLWNISHMPWKWYWKADRSQRERMYLENLSHEQSWKTCCSFCFRFANSCDPKILKVILKYAFVFRGLYQCFEEQFGYTATSYVTFRILTCIHSLPPAPLTYLLTYSLHGAESFLRS